MWIAFHSLSSHSLWILLTPIPPAPWFCLDFSASSKQKEANTGLFELITLSLSLSLQKHQVIHRDTPGLDVRSSGVSCLILLKCNKGVSKAWGLEKRNDITSYVVAHEDGRKNMENMAKTSHFSSLMLPDLTVDYTFGCMRGTQADHHESHLWPCWVWWRHPKSSALDLGWLRMIWSWMIKEYHTVNAVNQ